MSQGSWVLFLTDWSMMKNRFDLFNDWIDSVEVSVVNTLTKLSPWLSPVIPAYMTYGHVNVFLAFHPLLAFSAALLVEILGFATVATGISFWYYNRRTKAGAKKAPLWGVITIFVFYLAIVLAVNVIIDVTNQFGDATSKAWAVIAVRALFTLQTIPGAVLVALRVGHANLLKDLQDERTASRTKDAGNSQPSTESSSQDVKRAPDLRKLKDKLQFSDLTFIATSSPDQISQKYGQMSQRTAYSWKEYANGELARRNGNGSHETTSAG
jgi:hypothetical protein